MKQEVSNIMNIVSGLHNIAYKILFGDRTAARSIGTIAEAAQDTTDYNKENIEALTTTTLYKDCALLSKAAYGDAEEVEGWTLVGVHDDAASGYYGAAYKKGHQIVIASRGTSFLDHNDLAADINIALSGVSTVLKVLTAIAHSLCSKTTNDTPSPRLITDSAINAQIEAGVKFTGEIIQKMMSGNIAEQYELIFTGHSLGGAVAQMMALDQTLEQGYACPFVAFESPGSLDISSNYFGYETAQTIDIHPDSKIFVTGQNMVNTTNEHITNEIVRIHTPGEKKCSADALGYLEYTKQQHSISDIAQVLIENQASSLESIPSARWPSGAIAGYEYYLHHHTTDLIKASKALNDFHALDIIETLFGASPNARLLVTYIARKAQTAAQKTMHIIDDKFHAAENVLQTSVVPVLLKLASPLHTLEHALTQGLACAFPLLATDDFIGDDYNSLFTHKTDDAHVDLFATSHELISI